MNMFRRLEDSRLCEEFDQWFAGNIFVDRPVQQSRNFFEILMGNASMGWLGDEVSVFNVQYITIHNNISASMDNDINLLGIILSQHIHTYYRLISEKQRRFPNVLPQRVTHTDTYFWA